MQKVVITGGAGFIGYHLCKKLLEKGFEVVCIDNFLSGSRDNTTEFKDNPSYHFIEHDVIKPIDEIDIIRGSFCYFHLATPASPNKKSPRSYIQHPIETLLVNSVGTHNLLESALKDKALFVFASTSEVYGDPTVSPQKEDYWGNVNPNGVRSVYDEGKRFGEAMCMAYYRKYGQDIRIARIFNTYGEHMQKDDGRVISNFINQALSNTAMTIYGEGNQTRSFCYVSDLVEGLILMMERAEARGQVINLGNPDEYKIADIALKIKEKTGSASEIIHEVLPEDDPMQRRPDITVAKQLLGWEPKVGLEEGLEKAIEYFRDSV